MLVHPTPLEIKTAIRAAMSKKAAEWDAKTSALFPYAHAISAVEEGIDAAVKEHADAIARQHNTIGDAA